MLPASKEASVDTSERTIARAERRKPKRRERRQITSSGVLLMWLTIPGQVRFAIRVHRGGQSHLVYKSVNPGKAKILRFGNTFGFWYCLAGAGFLLVFISCGFMKWKCLDAKDVFTIQPFSRTFTGAALSKGRGLKSKF